ncbi:hypothetical protein WN51_13143 [Melipona quadrifasciata]|uniref:Uncharacterized protein n=1 Tax=Melipona quadrifasciata TaxID=166423 RepID=A0A0N0U5A9_9HYME|nr:hypothetical protein WN51_13143 [Melipona quadrifasciata]
MAEWPRPARQKCRSLPVHGMPQILPVAHKAGEMGARPKQSSDLLSLSPKQKPPRRHTTKPSSGKQQTSYGIREIKYSIPRYMCEHASFHSRRTKICSGLGFLKYGFRTLAQAASGCAPSVDVLPIFDVKQQSVRNPARMGTNQPSRFSNNNSEFTHDEVPLRIMHETANRQPTDTQVQLEQNPQGPKRDMPQCAKPHYVHYTLQQTVNMCKVCSITSINQLPAGSKKPLALNLQTDAVYRIWYKGEAWNSTLSADSKWDATTNGQR